MNTLRLSTNLHCQMCIDKVTPLLQADASIQSWTISDRAGVKMLEVNGHATEKRVEELLNKAGYSIIDAKEHDGAFWADKPKWKRAAFNTLNCLIGCSIGDFGMVIFLQAYYPSTPLMYQMALAIVAGLCTSIALETVLLKRKEAFPWGLALKTAFGMSFISMVAMEVAMTSTDFMITGGKASFSSPTYWLALLPAMVVGFLTPLPYNYYRLKKFNQSCH